MIQHTLKTKIQLQKQRRKTIFKKKNVPKDLETDETIEQNGKKVAKKISDKEINQIKYIKTAGYLDTKDQDKIK